MNKNIDCRLTPFKEPKEPFHSGPETSQFIHQVLEQERKDKKLRDHEKQLTLENPRIRDQNEITDISSELKALKHEELVQKKRQQQLRTNNYELRTLELQLRTAITTRELDKQRAFSENIKKEMEISKRKENEKTEKERLDYLQDQLDEEKKERQKKSLLRAELLNQIKGMQIKRKEDYTEVIRDRENMHKLMKKYDMEREKDLKEIERRKKETRQMMETYLHENAEFKKKQQLAERSDGSNMLKMLDDQEKERQRIKNSRIKNQAQYAAISDRIGEELYKTTSEQLKRETLLVDLLVEERNAKEDMRYRIELEKKGEERMHMRGELEHYLSEVQFLKKHTKEREDAYWANETKKLLDKKDKEENQKTSEKLQRMMEYRKSVLQLIEDRRQMRTMSAAEERNLYEMLIKEQLDLDDEVQKERLRMLQNCSSDLLRYLPVGALRESDRKNLGLPQVKEIN